MCDKGIGQGKLGQEQDGAPHCSNYRSGRVRASPSVVRLRRLWGSKRGSRIDWGHLASWRLWLSWSNGATAVVVVAIAVAIAPRDLGPGGTAAKRGRRLSHVDLHHVI